MLLHVRDGDAELYLPQYFAILNRRRMSVDYRSVREPPHSIFSECLRRGRFERYIRTDQFSACQRVNIPLARVTKTSVAQGNTKNSISKAQNMAMVRSFHASTAKDQHTGIQDGDSYTNLVGIGISRSDRPNLSSLESTFRICLSRDIPQSFWFGSFSLSTVYMSFLYQFIILHRSILYSINHYYFQNGKPHFSLCKKDSNPSKNQPLIHLFEKPTQPHKRPTSTCFPSSSSSPRSLLLLVAWLWLLRLLLLYVSLNFIITRSHLFFSRPSIPVQSYA